MDKPSLLIVGAGASGLMAAAELIQDYQVSVLEASDRPGGRILSIREDGIVVEVGAEFVHGNLPLTLNLLKEAGIQTVKVEGEMYRSRKGKFLEVEEMTEGWEGLLEKM